MAYLAGNRHHGYRIGCLQQRKLGFVSVIAVPVMNGRDPTISLNRNRGERRCSFKIVRNQVCRRRGSSESQGNSVDSFHFEDWMVLDIVVTEYECEWELLGVECC